MESKKHICNKESAVEKLKEIKGYKNIQNWMDNL